MKDYEKEVEKNEKRNEKFLEEFEHWLKEKKLVPKTINNHIGNVEFYLNNYLTYYEVQKMEEGYNEINGFLGDFFIRKCMWSTASTVKSTAASIKKFYQCMQELGHVKKEDYEFLCSTIKDNIEFWIEDVNKYNNDSYDMFW